MKFYICKHCGNIITKLNDSGVPLICCGEKMQELVPNTVEASGEKHVPVVEVQGDRVVVNVGAVDHPMAEEHHIEWVVLQTGSGFQVRRLIPGGAPHATFLLDGEKPLAVWAYCNLHGLWMTTL